MKISVRNHAVVGAIGAAALLFAGAPLAAAATVTTASSGTAFAVSNVDLLQTDLLGVVTTGQFGASGTASEPVLRDGANPNAGDDYGSTSLVYEGSTATYTLDTVTNVLGYTITSIATYGQWNDGRDRQDIVVEYDTVGNPGTYINIASYSFEPDPTFSRVVTTPSGLDTFLATGVQSLRFTFPNQENGYGGYRELDVFGVAVAVPEPETYALMLAGLAAVGALARRARRPRPKACNPAAPRAAEAPSCSSDATVPRPSAGAASMHGSPL